MWTIDSLPRVLRYLFVLRVNSPIVRLPAYPALEFSLALGSLLADRLLTKEARAWRKALEPWQEYEGDMLVAPPPKGQASNRNKRTAPPPRKNSRPIPDIVWPLDVMIHVYPGKTFYNQGEVILWECQLLGEQADHALFLEKILPTIEAAGMIRDKQWHRDNKLWGRYEIDSLYVARGQRWEPLAQEGKLDLRTRPTPFQWAEGLPFTMSVGRPFRKVVWHTPVDLSNIVLPETSQQNRRQQSNRQSNRRPNRQPNRRGQPKQQPPNLYTILLATAQRLGAPVPLWPSDTSISKGVPTDTAAAKRVDSTAQSPDTTSDEDLAPVPTVSPQTMPPLAVPPQTWEEVLALAQQIPVQRNDLRLPPKGWPGQAIGTQTYEVIPPEILPYLTLASIVHVGRYTHFGGGGFMLLL